jgi:hypothetical protein
MPTPRVSNPEARPGHPNLATALPFTGRDPARPLAILGLAYRRNGHHATLTEPWVPDEGFFRAGRTRAGPRVHAAPTEHRRAAPAPRRAPPGVRVGTLTPASLSGMWPPCTGWASSTRPARMCSGCCWAGCRLDGGGLAAGLDPVVDHQHPVGWTQQVMVQTQQQLPALPVRRGLDLHRGAGMVAALLADQDQPGPKLPSHQRPSTKPRASGLTTTVTAARVAAAGTACAQGLAGCW